MRTILFISLIVACSTQLLAQKIGKKVQFVGSARTLLSYSDFRSEGVDTVTAPSAFGGYGLIDLGVKINPNSQTEILGMFRINTALGGFWGANVSFDVRQLHVKGVAANTVRYQIGTIDFKLTPYTFFNHNPDILLPSTGTMRIKEEIFDYESFFTDDNTWRQQGAAIDFALQFPKIIQEIQFNGFICRLEPSNFQNVFDRLFGGGNVVVQQSKYFTLGVNHVSIFDVRGTALSDDVYSNNVSSLTYDFTYDMDNFTLGLDGESGISSTIYSPNDEASQLSDYFVHLRAYFNLKKTNLSFDLGYMDNGPDFRAFGAQSKRVNFNQQNTFYPRYTNDQTLRPLSYFDLYNDPTLYDRNINVGVMAYDPAVSNVLPYGITTFNRRGGYVGVSYSDSLQVIAADLKYHLLQEVRGQGTETLKNFHYLQGNLRFSLSNLLKWKNNVALQLGAAYQNTTRSSDVSFEAINLNSLLLNTGIEVEFVDRLTLMINYFMMQSQGNELLPQRNTTEEIINFQPYSINGVEWNLASGLRFNFSKNVYLAAMYEFNNNRFVDYTPYQYHQVSVYYIMNF